MNSERTAGPSASAVPAEYLALTGLDFTSLRCGVSPTILDLIAIELMASAERIRAAELDMGGRA